MPTAPKQFRFGQAPSAKQHSAEQRLRKGTVAQRGYGGRWQRFREWYYSHWFNAVCGCGCGEPANELDHIEAVSGKHDERFFDVLNVIGLASGCHSRKTALVDCGMGHPRTAEGQALLLRLKAEAQRRAEMMGPGGYS